MDPHPRPPLQQTPQCQYMLPLLLLQLQMLARRCR
jgi:hypothetical protein